MQECNFLSFYAQYLPLDGLKQMKIPYVSLPTKLWNSRFRILNLSEMTPGVKPLPADAKKIPQKS